MCVNGSRSIVYSDPVVAPPSIYAAPPSRIGPKPPQILQTHELAKTQQPCWIFLTRLGRGARNGRGSTYVRDRVRRVQLCVFVLP